MIRDVAGFRHAVIAEVHRLGHDHRHQAVFIGDFLGVARLQRCQRREEVALPIHKPEDVGDIARRELVVEAGLQGRFRVELKFAPGQFLAYRIVNPGV